jgi:hypothetical protein
MDNLVRDAYSAKHAERMLDARKEIKKTHADLLAGSLEDAPFGILGLLYVRLLWLCLAKESQGRFAGTCSKVALWQNPISCRCFL